MPTMSQIRRYFTPGKTVFLTLVTDGREPLFRTTEVKTAILEILLELRTVHGFLLHAWAVLDDHLHLLVSDPNAEVSQWVQKLKLRVARRQFPGRKKVWQHRYWDHLIRDENDLYRHVDYIHGNPVKHGLVKRTSDYAWSSFRSFVRRGWYEAHWSYVADEDFGAGAE